MVGRGTLLGMSDAMSAPLRF